MKTYLRHLQPGTPFYVPDLDLLGTLLHVNDCRAHVEINATERVVQFTDRQGNTREFVGKCSRKVDWTPQLVVEVE